MSQTQQVEHRTKDTAETPIEELPQDTAKGDKLKADIDAILDDIDKVLMENAEQFVSEYRQRGGE